MSSPCAVCARPLAQHTLNDLRNCDDVDYRNQRSALTARGEHTERAALILGLTRGRDEARVKQIERK